VKQEHRKSANAAYALLGDKEEHGLGENNVIKYAMDRHCQRQRLDRVYQDVAAHILSGRIAVSMLLYRQVY